MDLREALDVLGVEEGATAEEVRASYLELVRSNHPDVADNALSEESRTVITARVTAAYATVRGAIADHDGRRVPASPPRQPTPPAPPPATPGPTVEAGEHDVISVGADPATTYAVLYEAAGRVGHVAYYDRQLGILEIIVRFEGGPSCSVLMTLQPHPEHPQITEIVCTMESIEAAPTPPIAPVM